ncbi:MAG: class I SAM-dependent methyltransferase [Acidimicrobiales bacterium]|nr:class I SAM-dependent methyltransferase [Acidimicrobiales bacterium]
MDADAWDDRYRATELVWSASPNQFVADRVAGITPGRALDVACGEGRNAIWLAEHGWDVLGIDFSPVAIDKARQIAERRADGITGTIDFRVGDVSELGGGDSFDLVLVVYLHLPEDEMRAVLADCAGITRAGGTLLVLGHHVENLDRGHGGPPDRSVLHDPAVIADALPMLDIVEAGEVSRTVETDEGERTAIDSLVIAHR